MILQNWRSSVNLFDYRTYKSKCLRSFNPSRMIDFVLKEYNYYE